MKKFWLLRKQKKRCKIQIINGSYGRNTDGYSISSNKKTEVDENWKETYGLLSAGKYRIGKPVTKTYWNSDYETKLFYVEIEITD